MTGAQGTLGILLDISLRLMPKPEHNITYLLPHSQQEALEYFTNTRRSNLPITASCHHKLQTYIRLSGSEKHLATLIKSYDIQTIEDSDDFWRSIRDHKHDFFQKNDKPLWRISCAPAASLTQQVDTRLMLEWNGAVRWITSNMPANILQNIAYKANGEAVLFRGNVPGMTTFRKPEPVLFALYQRLKRQLDPKGIFNPDRIYEGL
jgi:glycolate oxidase FAD binding subunit